MVIIQFGLLLRKFHLLYNWLFLNNNGTGLLLVRGGLLRCIRYNTADRIGPCGITLDNKKTTTFKANVVQ